MADDQIPVLVLDSRFGGIGALFKRVVARAVRFLIAYEAHVHEWLRARIVRNEERTDRLEAEVAEMRVLVAQLRVALPQALSRLQVAIDRCTWQIETFEEREVLTELAGVRRALAQVESRLAVEGSPAEAPEPVRLPAATVAAPKIAEGGGAALFADAFRPRDPLRPVGELRRSNGTGESNGVRREP